MVLKNVLIEKIPRHLQDTPHFSALIDIIKESSIVDESHLYNFLRNKIEVTERLLNENSSIKLTKEISSQLEMLNGCLNLTKEHLI
jgi:hypothetical protein